MKKNNINQNILSILLIFGLTIQLSGCPDSQNQSNTQYIHVGPNWDAMQKIDASSSKFKITANIKDKFKLGDEITATITSEKTGKLWMVFIDLKDNVNLMFPNSKQKDNNIKAGESITIPSQDSNWAIKAGEPTGQSIVSFIVTTGDVNLNDVLNSGKKDTMKEALIMVDTSNQWSIATHIVSVEK